MRCQQEKHLFIFGSNEGLLTGIMYDVPSDPTVGKVVITRGCVENNEEPVRIPRAETSAEEGAARENGEGRKSAS